jgi:hypothetical protein
MTPKQKAIEIYNRYFSMIEIITPIDKVSSIPYVKKCALITVGEVIYAIDWHNIEIGHENFQYWWEVKKKIEEL